MSLAESAVRKPAVTWFGTILIILGGLAAYFQLGQLEDPEFTVKDATVVTIYPGASAQEVELEVTDRLERAIQEMPQVKEFESRSSAGMSHIKVSIMARFGSDELPQIWDVLRKKLRDAAGDLPPGVQEPIVGDDFGDVYGFLFAVYSDGYSDAQLENYADELKRELSLVKGVARVELWGVRHRCIYLDTSESRLHALGLTMADLQRTLQQQNMVVQSGAVELQGERWRVDISGTFTSPLEIGELVIQRQIAGNTDALLRVKDVARVDPGYVDPPANLMRYNGWPAIGIAISNVSGANIVTVGGAVDARLKQLSAEPPVGIEIGRISWQSDLVSRSIRTFVVSLIEAVAIVLVVLWLAMGLRVAAVVGIAGLVFVIVGTFLIMKLWGIDLQRMSLGALVVAMGMMVDNAIVIADGILVRLQKGMDRLKAAAEAATQPSMPLLGATIIAVMAFYPIYASEEGAGEYCASLFQVIAASLLLSWMLSVTVAPLMCLAMLPSPKPGDEHVDPYGGPMYRVFRKVLSLAIRARWAVVIVMVGLFVAAILAFSRVDQMFFPASDRAQLMIDYWMPEGTTIDHTSEGLRKLEDHLKADPRVTAVSTFVGQGPPRFYLPVSPEKPYPSYGQIIVNAPDYLAVEALIPDVEQWVSENVTEAEVVVRRYGLGPSETWQVEARFSGPGDADPVVLRELAGRAEDVLRQSPQAKVVRNNWRERARKMAVRYDQERGRWAGVSRDEIAEATSRAYDGLPIGQYRERDKLMPIILRNSAAERAVAAAALGSIQVSQGNRPDSLPLSQVTRSIGVQWEDPLIWRWNRRRAITVQAVPSGTAPALHKEVKAPIEAIELPPGYGFQWDGEYKSSREAQASLVPGIIPAVGIMAMILVWLFNGFRQPLVIACIVPFAIVGVSIGLLTTGQPFGFVALLGAMSLSGMMIKNAVVMLDEVGLQIAAGASRYQAVVHSAVTRFRPILLAAGTTVLGVIPLLQDVFWVSMAVVIMFGLTVGSMLTMIGVPVLYACFYRLSEDQPAAAGDQAPPPEAIESAPV